MRAATPWWQGAVVYQVYPRSFSLADPAGRRARLGLPPGSPLDRLAGGAGDLAGIRRRLAHIASLGAEAIWLSPVYPSPMADFGYDVADYCDIDPLFGDLEEFDRLLGEAHGHGLRVLLDFVPNHTSDRHPWFEEARSSRGSPKRDWYIWRDPDPDQPERPPNNWRRAFGEGPAWTFDEATGQWYLHLFLPEQPDLNWENPAVEAAMTGVLDFWLGRGVDGFRIDVVHGLAKPPGLPDVPPEQEALPYSSLNDEPATHELLRRMRRHVDSFPQQPVLVGEVFLLDAAKVGPYYGEGDELHLAFNFTPMFSPFRAASFRRRLEEIAAHLGPRHAWPTWVLSSHDRPRHRTRYGGSERRARAAAVLSYAMRGTVFLYAGEELGLEDAVVPPGQQLDPGGRDGCRAPIPWESGPGHGWALGGAEPWLPFPPRAEEENAAREGADPHSVLSLYRLLGALRRHSSLLRLGDLELCETGDEQLLVFARRLPGAPEEALVAVNFSEGERPLALPEGPCRVAAGSGGAGSLSRAGEEFAGRLGPEEAVILQRGAPASEGEVGALL